MTEEYPSTDIEITQTPVVLVEVNGNLLPKVAGKFVANWTKYQTDQLVDLWSKGFSASQIGNQVGKTRNAVIGKVHRLKLESRSPKNQYSDKVGSERQPTRVPSKTARNDSEMRKVVPPKFFAAPEPLPWRHAEPISIMELGPRTCRSIVGRGDDGLATYCGELTYWNDDTQRWNSYCGTHHEIYYDFNRRRRF